MEIHKPLGPQKFLAASAIPYSKSGYGEDVKRVFQTMGVEMKTAAANPEWVTTSTQEKSVTLESRKVIENLVPNVKGMGVMDAVYLLENAGLKVRFVGRGAVKSQSIQAGTRAHKGSVIVLELT